MKVTSFKYLCSGIKYYSIIRKTPFGNSLTIDLAKAASSWVQMNYIAAAETLVCSWNDIVVEVLDRYQYLIDRQQNRLAI